MFIISSILTNSIHHGFRLIALMSVLRLRKAKLPQKHSRRVEKKVCLTPKSVPLHADPYEIISTLTFHC